MTTRIGLLGAGNISETHARAASASSPVVTDARGYRRVLEGFVVAIRTRATPLCDGREGRRSVAFVEAMYRSARARTAVTLEGGALGAGRRA